MFQETKTLPLFIQGGRQPLLPFKLGSCLFLAFLIFVGTNSSSLAKVTSLTMFLLGFTYLYGLAENIRVYGLGVILFLVFKLMMLLLFVMVFVVVMLVVIVVIFWC